MKYTFLLLALIFSSALFAQKSDIKFGKVSEEELAMTVYPLDTSADAVVLADFGNIDFLYSGANPSYRIKRHTRIKILKRAGFSQGDISIPYYSYGNEESVKGLQLKVFSSDGTSTEMEKKDYFKDEYSEYYKRIKIAAPNLQVGSIIDLTYETESKNIFQLPTWYFQKQIPTIISELNIEIPEWYNYAIITQGQKLNIDENSTGESTFFVSFGNNLGDSMTLRTVKKRMALMDAPALKEEPFITTMEDYYTKVRFQLSAVQYPNFEAQDVSNSWEKLAKDLHRADEFGAQLNQIIYFRKIYRKVLKVLPNQGNCIDTILAVQQFLNNNIKINSSQSIYIRGKLKDIWTRKEARPSELNLLTVALLRQFGIEANPALISTRSNGKPIIGYPLIEQFNYVLVIVRNDDQYIMVDVGNKNSAPGYPRLNALNGNGFLLQGRASSWIELPVRAMNETYLFSLEMDKTGQLEGDIAINFEGYGAMNFRSEVEDGNPKDFVQKMLSRKFPDIEILDFTVENLEKITESVKIKVKCAIPGAATSTGDFIYFSPVLLSDYLKSPFKLEKRAIAVDFPYPFKEQLIINIKFPEGYTLEESPEPTRISLPKEAGLFQYQLNKNGINGIQLVTKTQINTQHFEVEEYDGLRYFFETVAGKYQESLVLKRNKE